MPNVGLALMDLPGKLTAAALGLPPPRSGTSTVARFVELRESPRVTLPPCFVAEQRSELPCADATCARRSSWRTCGGHRAATEPCVLCDGPRSSRARPRTVARLRARSSRRPSAGLSSLTHRPALNGHVPPTPHALCVANQDTMQPTDPASATLPCRVLCALCFMAWARGPGVGARFSWRLRRRPGGRRRGAGQHRGHSPRWRSASCRPRALLRAWKGDQCMRRGATPERSRLLGSARSRGQTLQGGQTAGRPLRRSSRDGSQRGRRHRRVTASLSTAWARVQSSTPRPVVRK
jgi:hypothetical protein